MSNYDSNKICELLTKLKIDYQDKGAFLVCKTMCHHTDGEEASHKLYYYKESGRFYCYTRCGSMSVKQFLTNYYSVRGLSYDASAIYQMVENCKANIVIGNKFILQQSNNDLKEKYLKKKISSKLPTYPKGILNVFDKYYPIEWIKDGISRKTMDKYDISFSTTQNKIIIPHYNVSGDLIGIRGRTLNHDEEEKYGKYMPIQIENKMYSHPLSLNLYGLNLSKNNISKYGVCYVMEGEKSVLQCDSFSMPNVAVAVCGSVFNKYQLELLLKNCKPKEIVICFDNEELENENRYFNKLYSICAKYRNYCNISFIYDRDGLTKKKDSPTDRGEVIFKQLLSKRIKVT